MFLPTISRGDNEA